MTHKNICRAIGVLYLLGGVVSLLSFASTLVVGAWTQRWLDVLLILPISVLAVACCAAGIWLLRGEKNGLRLGALLACLQLLQVSGVGFDFAFMAGFGVIVGWEAPANVFANAAFGGNIAYAIGEGGPARIGVNLAALGLLLYLGALLDASRDGQDESLWTGDA